MSHIRNGYYFFMYSYDLTYDVLDDFGNRIETKSYQRFKSYYTRAFDTQSHDGERIFRSDAYDKIAVKIGDWINRLQEENNETRKTWAERKRINPNYRAPRPARLKFSPYNQRNVGTVKAGLRKKGQSLPEDSDARVGDPTKNRI